jgi:hypothetical protein
VIRSHRGLCRPRSHCGLGFSVLNFSVSGPVFIRFGPRLVFSLVHSSSTRGACSRTGLAEDFLLCSIFLVSSPIQFVATESVPSLCEISFSREPEHASQEQLPQSEFSTGVMSRFWFPGPGHSNFSLCSLCLLRSASGSTRAKEHRRRFFRSCARSSILAVDFSCVVIRVLVGIADIVLSRRIKRLVFSSLFSFSHGGISVTLTRYLVKCL